MKKIFIVLVMLLSLGSTLWIQQAAADEFFSIRTADDWLTFRNAVETAQGQYRVNARLEADITTSGGIGLSDNTPYWGTLDGNGHTITATNIWRTDGKPCALFCYVKDATIRDLHVKGTISGGIHSAGLVGRVLGSPTITISRVWVSTAVTASNTHAGGIIGHSDRSSVYMTDCRFDGSVTTNNASGSYAGDIIGWCNGGAWHLQRVYDQGSPKAVNMYFCYDYNASSGATNSWGTNGRSFTVTQHNWTSVDYYNKTDQNEVVNLMNTRKVGSWEIVDGKAVPKLNRQQSMKDWTFLSTGGSTGYTLSSGHYYIDENITFSNGDTGSGLTIADGATVYIYIPEGVTLTAIGGNADGQTGAGAGIELPSGSTLYLMGKGTVDAKGGNAANGGTGGTGGDATGGNGSWTQTGAGGNGGYGGGGAGAGIGTRGGGGGSGGSGGGANYYDNGKEDDAFRGTDGSAGKAGSTAGAMGNLYVVTSSVHLNATGGNAGTSGGSGGQRGRGYAYDGYSYNVTVAGGGGGGGGGFGGAAFPIGTGGCGGGGGGGGAGGAQDWRSNSNGGVYDVTALGGSGGKNADGQTSGGDGTEAGTNGTAHSQGWVSVENGSFDSDDWHSASGAAPSGSGGNGGGRGTPSDGMSVANLHNYILNLNVLNQAGGSVQDTKTITYQSNKSTGNVTVTIPTTYELGLIEAQKYVTKWYTSNSCTGNDWKAAYDEKEIPCTTTDLYGVWQNYSDLFKDGTGTKGNPFIIEDDGLRDLADYVNAGGNTRGLYFKQQGEINANNWNWTPIGHKRVFEGDYDGDGNRIINATNTSCDYDAFGIFGKVSGTIHNLGVENCNLQTTRANSRGGGIAGMLLRCDMEQATTAQIRNCYVAKNTIKGAYSGGLVGEMSDASSLSYCLETQSTLHTNTGGNIWSYCGGIASRIGSECQVDKCFTTGPLCSNGYNQQTNTEYNLNDSQMQSGEIAWKLNNQSPYGAVWFQNLSGSNIDKYPVLDKQHGRVYYDGSNYTNTGSGPLFAKLTGQGTADKPFLINNVDDFEVMADFCNDGNNSSGFYFLQTADFDLNGGGLTTPHAFAGIYDGGGHTIRNGLIEKSGVVGIFEVVSGTVTHLCVENTTVKYNQQGMRAGGIAARITDNGVISNCFVKGCTIANNGLSGVVGGIAADMFDQAVIKNCLVVNTSLTASRTGSICSDTKADTRIERCYSDGAALVSSDSYCTFDQAEIVDAETLASGEICYRLNNSPQADNLSPIWYQAVTIEGHNDATPVLSSDHAIVFKRNDKYTNDYRGISSLGAGTQASPYLVGSAADLKKISDTFETMRWSDFYVKQTADIDMKEAEPIAPIGIGTNGFMGHYNGDGHVIRNLSFSDCKGSSLGLFNNIIGTVERLGIETSTFTASLDNNRVGAFAGKITGSGQLLNCYALGCTVSYNYKSGVVVGALVGELADQSSIQSSYGYLNTVIGQIESGNKRYGYIVGYIGSNASATLVFTNGPTLCADAQSGYNNIIQSETNVAELRFKTGELAHQLDGSPVYDGTAGCGTTVWRQTIKTDLWPIPGSSHGAVYKLTHTIPANDLGQLAVTQTMYSNNYLIPEPATLTLNPNYKDHQNQDIPSNVLSLIPADNNCYVPSYNLGNSVPSRNYFFFTGWNTLANGKGTHYAPNGELLPFTGAKTLYAEWDMSVPSDGTALEVTLPEDKTSFKIYDAAGNDTPYGNNYNGKLTLVAPEDHVIVLTGTISTEALNDNQACDYMIVRNGRSSSPIMSNGQSTDVAGIGHVFVSTTDGAEKNIGRLVSTGKEMTIEFVTNGQNNFDGLNLTATVVATSISQLGQGTEVEPFEIETAENLQTLREYLQLAETTNYYIRQIDDIDLQGASIAPLVENKAFAGHYDGEGYSIKNGVISSDEGTKVGLFANLTGTVTRLCMEDITVSYQQDNAEAGAIAGRLSDTGSITNCRFKNITVANNNHTGGSEGAVVGTMDNTATITGCLVINADKDICGNKTIGTNEHCYTFSTTDDDFNLQRGQICYLLNDGDTSDDAVWRQEIGTDALPVPDSDSPIVYYYNDQKHTGYTNEETCTVVGLRVQDVAFENAITDYELFKGCMIRLTEYKPVHAGLSLERWSTQPDGGGTVYTPDAMVVLSTDALILYPQWNIMPQIIPGDGTEQNPYIIDSTDDWDALATNITYFNLFNGYSGKFIRLDADIDVTKIMGTMSAQATQGNAFCGTFDGNSHTITATISDTEHQGTAPFCYIKNATIKNLIVNGTITAGTMLHAAALVGFADGTSRIENCKVTANVSGGSHIGGIMGHGLDGDITINGCVFSGTMTGGATAKGAIVGWGNNGTKTVTNCIYLMPEGQSTTGLDLVKKHGGSESVTNTYKTTSAGIHGTQASDHINAGEIRQELLRLYGYTMYGVDAYTVSGVDEAYDLRNTDPVGTAIITPAVTAPSSTALTLGVHFAATLNGEDVTFPINIDEVGDYTLVLTGIGSYVGSKTYQIHVIGDHIRITLAQEVGTYSSNEDLNFTGSNLKAYIAAGYNKSENQVLLVRVYDVPQGTGIFLRGEAGESYNISKTTSQSYYVNMLKANLTAGPIAQTDGSMSNFLLAKVDDVFKFCAPSATATLGANRAYLQVPTSFITASAREVDIVFDEDATGITTNFTNITNSDEWYDLQGRPIANGQKPTAKGLYIVNGRKTVIK